jgi:hypothetical protein
VKNLVEIYRFTADLQQGLQQTHSKVPAGLQQGVQQAHSRGTAGS